MSDTGFCTSSISHGFFPVKQPDSLVLAGSFGFVGMQGIPFSCMELDVGLRV